MRDFDKEITEHQKEIDRIKTERESYYQDELAVIKDKVSALNSTDLLDLIQEETTKRRVKRDEIRGGNDIEINKINMLLKDEFWCTKIYLLFEEGGYTDFTQDKVKAEKYVNCELERTYKEEIVDLRDIY